MVIWLVIVLIIALALAARLVLLRGEVRRMTRLIQQINPAESNQRLTVMSQDRQITALAAAVNRLYADVYRERGEHRRAMDDLRQSMANISHDLRTPLTSVIGYLKLLQTEESVAGQARHYLDIAYSKASSLHQMIGSLFLLARLDAGAHVFHMERVNAGEVLAEELAAFHQTLTEGGREPEIRLAEEPLWIVADSAGLSRVFANLLQNMVKHGAGGGCRVVSERNAGTVRLLFSNEAPGLTAEDAEKLFLRFFTADRMRSGENTGLGLAIVKEYVEHMGGRVRCELEAGWLRFTLEWDTAPGS